MKQKISRNQKLDQIVLTLSEKKPVRDEETGREIPSMWKQDFCLSVPYYLDDSDERKIILKPSKLGLFRYQSCPLNKREDSVKAMTKAYLTGGKIEALASIDIQTVTLALYPQSQPSPEGKLNVCETTGTVYLIKKDSPYYHKKDLSFFAPGFKK